MANLRTAARLTGEIESAGAKARELAPQVESATKLVKDLEQQLATAREKSDAVGAQHWIATSTANDRAEDLRWLRSSNPHVFAEMPSE